MVGYRLVLKRPVELHWTVDWSCLVSFDGCRSHSLTSNHQNRLTAAASEDAFGHTPKSSLHTDHELVTRSICR